MNPDLVSVVIPTRNSARYLPTALESVMRCDYEPFEVIVVDAGSTDSTTEIACSFPPVRVIQQAGTGLSAAWNSGIDEAQGAFVAFLDSDDYWADGKLQTQLRSLREHPEAQLTTALFRFFLEEGCAVPVGFKQELLDGPQAGQIPGTLVARRALFDRVGVFDTQFAIAADVDWFARVKDSGEPALLVEEVLLHKRVHEANLSSNAAVNSRELWRRCGARFSGSGPATEERYVVPPSTADPSAAAASAARRRSRLRFKAVSRPVVAAVRSTTLRFVSWTRLRYTTRGSIVHRSPASRARRNQSMSTPPTTISSNAPIRANDARWMSIAELSQDSITGSLIG